MNNTKQNTPKEKNRVKLCPCCKEIVVYVPDKNGIGHCPYCNKKLFDCRTYTYDKER